MRSSKQSIFGRLGLSCGYSPQAIAPDLDPVGHSLGAGNRLLSTHRRPSLLTAGHRYSPQAIAPDLDPVGPTITQGLDSGLQSRGWWWILGGGRDSNLLSSPGFVSRKRCCDNGQQPADPPLLMPSLPDNRYSRAGSLMTDSNRA
jgi:hypothetical protein